MTELAEGNLEVGIPYTEQRDEIGTMARTVQVFKERGQEVRRLQDAAERQKEQAAAEQKAAMNALADTFEASIKAVVGSVAGAAIRMRDSAASMSSVSEKATRQSEAVGVAAEQATANVQTVSAATEQLSASVAEIGSSGRAVEQDRGGRGGAGERQPGDRRRPGPGGGADRRRRRPDHRHRQPDQSSRAQRDDRGRARG